MEGLMNELYHHGIKGMKWGVRRYQNPDGSLTSAGKRRRALAIAASPGGYAIYKGVKSVKARRAKRKEIANYTDEQKHDIAFNQKSSAKDTYKYRKYLSDRELLYRVNRLSNERRLKDLMKDESTNQYMEVAKNILVSYGAVKTSSALFGKEAADFVSASRSIDAPRNDNNQNAKPNNDAYLNYINSEKKRNYQNKKKG